MRRTSLCLIASFIALASAHSTAQHQLIPVAQMRGEPALELQLRALRDSTGAHADNAGALEAQSEIARIDDALQAAYDTGAERDQLELLWKRRSELLGALISVRQRHVEISRI